MYQYERIISEIGGILGLPSDFDEEGCVPYSLIRISDMEEWYVVADRFISGYVAFWTWQLFLEKIMVFNSEMAMENTGNLVYLENDNALLLMDTVTDLSNVHAIIAHLENLWISRSILYVNCIVNKEKFFVVCC